MGAGAGQIVGGVLGGVSKTVGAEMEADALQYNADINKYKAAYARSKAKVDEGMYRKGLDRKVGRGQMVAGATGFGQVGSNADIIDQIRTEGEIDAALIRHGGEMEAWAAENQATLQENSVPAVRAAGHFSAAATVLGSTGYSGGASSGYTAGGGGGSPYSWQPGNPARTNLDNPSTYSWRPR